MFREMLVARVMILAPTAAYAGFPIFAHEVSRALFVMNGGASSLGELLHAVAGSVGWLLGEAARVLSTQD